MTATTPLPFNGEVAEHPWPDFVGSWPRLRGRQEPEFESRHPGDESEGDRCAQFGYNLSRSYGTKTRCMPWEWLTIRGILSLQPPNEYGERIWTHRDVCIEATRQQGKTLIVVLLILFYLFVVPALGRSRPLKIVYTAQRWATALDVFNRVVKVINAVPHLKRRLARPPSTRANHGVIEVVLKRGRDDKPLTTAVVEFAPRSQEFGRGITELDILFLDEAYDIDPGIENDLTGAQSASENPQTIYLSTPPVFLKHPKCHSLADMHRLGHSRAPLLFYRLFAAPRHMSRTDPETWAAAQPSYGVATNEREIGSKLQKAKNAVKRAIFDADYCGWGDYPPPEQETESEIPADKWAGMRARIAPKLAGSPALGLARDAHTGIWRITGAWYTDQGLAHLEIGYSRAVASPQVVKAVVDLVAAWDPVAVAIKSRSDAAAIEAELLKVEIEPVMVDSGLWSQWCGSFLNAALAQKLSHSDQAELNDAAGSAVRKNTPAGGFVWDETEAGPCAQSLVSATLAYGALLTFADLAAGPPASPAFESAADDFGDYRSYGSEIDVLTTTF